MTGNVLDEYFRALAAKMSSRSVASGEVIDLFTARAGDFRETVRVAWSAPQLVPGTRGIAADERFSQNPELVVAVVLANDGRVRRSNHFGASQTHETHQLLGEVPCPVRQRLQDILQAVSCPQETKRS